MLTERILDQLLEHHVDVLSVSGMDDYHEGLNAEAHPERMGVQRGWTLEKFLEKSRTVLPTGRVYQNLGIGCDAFHEEVLLGRSSPRVSIQA